MPRIVCLSDAHGSYRKVKIPEGDVLILAGDMTRKGDLQDWIKLNEFLGTLPHLHKICVAGNGDYCFQEEPAKARKILSKALYLQDEKTELLGLKIYGSPWQPRFLDMAFNLERGTALQEVWAKIPVDTDILITHCPPRGILDKTALGQHIGCEELKARIEELKLKLHVFGHVHESRGVLKQGETTFVNAAVSGLIWGKHEPFVVEL